MEIYNPLTEFNPQVGPAVGVSQAPQFSWQSRLGSGVQNFLGDRDLALALLTNSGPSTQRRSFGQILGSSMMQADQAKQMRQDDALKQAYMLTQMQAMGVPKENKLVSIIGPDGKPTLVRQSDAVGKQPYAGGADSRPSAFIQAYDRYIQGGGKLPMMDFAKEFAASQAQYPYQLGDIAGEQTLIPRTNPTAASGALPTRRLSTLPQESNAKQVLAQATESGKTTGEKVTNAQFDLPRVEQNITQAIGDIQKLKNHPGLGNITGLYSKAPIIPGTDQAAADALAKQVQGQTFLQAYNSLKGAGAITDIEGQKAEASVARLSRSQSAEDYRKALDDLTSVLQRGRERMRQQAKQPSTPNAADPLGIR